MEHRQKLPIRSSCKTQVVIDVSSPSGNGGEAHLRLSFTIDNGRLSIAEEGGGRVVTTRGNIAAARCWLCACVLICLSLWEILSAITL